MINPFHLRKYIPPSYYWLLVFLFFLGCTNSDKKVRKENVHGSYIIRKKDEFFFQPFNSRLSVRESYPWEKATIGKLAKISKNHFRCKGNTSNPPYSQQKEGKAPVYFRDCGGGKQHGLPLFEGNEFIYPCLIDLLNYVQEKTQKKVVITTGHRCPQHNTYSDPSPSNWGSKHMIGAEVDFYVEAFEEEPLKIVEILMQYYQEKDSENAYFLRYEKEVLNVRIAPWYNKEIFIKLYQKDEGRDKDNEHGYPYIGVQVRYDRDLKKRVMFDSKLAENYLRH